MRRRGERLRTERVKGGGGRRVEMERDRGGDREREPSSHLCREDVVHCKGINTKSTF